MSKIDKNKIYKTVCDRRVRIYATDGDGAYPVHGAIMTPRNSWEAAVWTKRGESEVSPDTLALNLIEVKPRIKGWMNVYRDGSVALGGMIFGNEKRATEAANLAANRDVVARIQIDIEEGEGL